jgi:hypothetical protein
MIPLLIAPVLVAAPQAQETPPFEVAREYVRELGELWAIQQEVDQEMVQDKASADPQNRSLMTTIRHATRVNLALKTNIAILGKMRMTRPGHEQTLGFLTSFYQRRIDLNNQLIQITTEFIVPKNGVDYGKLAAQVPEITANMEDVDKGLFQITALVFMSFVDTKADSQNRANHLLITKDQRDRLVRNIENGFGANLNKDRRYVVSEADLFRMKLLEFKCSDEPWD